MGFRFSFNPSSSASGRTADGRGAPHFALRATRGKPAGERGKPASARRELRQGKRVVIFMGPVGAGKGTQADIVAEQPGHVHIESSHVIETQLNAHEPDETFIVDGKTYRYGDEKRLWLTGKLNTTEVVTHWMEREIRNHARKEVSLVFSGSPRTMLEAKRQVPLYKELYGEQNIYILLINVPKETSIYRNTHRRICKECRHPIPFTEETKNLALCSKCGGELMHRELDKPDVITVRLQEYEKRTLPIIEYLKHEGLVIHEIDGGRKIEEVAHEVARVLNG